MAANVNPAPAVGNNGSVDDPFTQCHNILNMLQSKLAAVKTESEATTSYLAGTSSTISKTLLNRKEWIIDSGASTHIFFSKDMFATLDPIHTTVVLPDNTRITVHFAGTGTLFGELTLQRVLYVPQFQYNLLSIGALTTDTHFIVHFHTNACDIQERSILRTIGKGKIYDGLYILEANGDSDCYVRDTTVYTTTAQKNTITLWHSRLDRKSVV